MGTDDLKKKAIARNTAKKRKEQKAVLISLEDEKSSKYYFEKLLVDKKLTGEVIFAKHIGTDAESVLKAIVKHKREHPKIVYEKEWVVFDRDDNSKKQINSTIQRAKDLGVCIAISNEAYELWLLLHFEPLTRATNRKDLNKKLNEYFLSYFGQDYSKSAQDVYVLIIGFQNKAICNAKNLLIEQIRNHGKLDPEKQNPLTLVYQLVECLNSLYDEEKDCGCFPQDS
jgi:hypothetical protein